MTNRPTHFFLRVTEFARTALVPGVIPMAESYRTIHHRIHAMKHFNRQISPLSKAAVLALAFATVAFLPTYRLAQAAVRQQSPSQTSDPIVIRNRDKPGGGLLVASLEFNHQDIRVALRELFRAANKPYTIDPAVKGSVTLSLRNVMFRPTLMNVLRQCDATFTVNNGVFEVRPALPSSEPAVGITFPQHDYAKGAAHKSFVIPSMEMQEADVREVIRSMFKQIHGSYSISPDVQGTVTISVKSVEFDTALTMVLRQVDSKFLIDQQGVYLVVRKTHDNP